MSFLNHFKDPPLYMPILTVFAGHFNTFHVSNNYQNQKVTGKRLLQHKDT